jgi:hypothetical protein
MLWIEDIVKNTLIPFFFLSILELTWMILCILTRWLLGWVHFQPVQVRKMEVNSENRKKPWNKERRIKKKSKVSLILLNVNHTFFILDLWNGPQAFRHIHNTLRKTCFLYVKKGRIQGSICFKLVPKLLVPRPLFKVALIL